MKLAFIKIIFLISPVICYSNTPSFSFSKEEGLREIASSLENKNKSQAPSDETTKADNISKTSAKQTDPLEVTVKQSGSVEITTTQSEPLKTTAKQSESVEATVKQSGSVEATAEQSEPLNEEAPAHSISEDFAPEEEEYIEGAGFLNSFIENSSWFFQNKNTDHKIGITPNYSHDTTEGHRLGLSLFSYSPKDKGYYLNAAINKYLFRPYARFSMSFIGNREGLFRSKANLIYNNHYEIYYGDIEKPQSMQASLAELTQIYAHRFIFNYDLAYQEKDQDFYFGLGAKALIRKERVDLQNNKQYFPNEAFLFLRAFVGFDNRDNVRNPKKGSFHQVSFGCKANLSYSDSHCQGEGDLRFYFPLFYGSDSIFFKDSILALRAFFGSSVLSSSYTTKYSLGRYSFFQGINTLRAFKRNRFIGDKIYFAQSELRWPIWDKYLQGIVFFELGETAELSQFFKDLVVDYGAGLRFGFPPKYDLKLRLDWGTGHDLQGVRNYDLTISFLQVF